MRLILLLSFLLASCAQPAPLADPGEVETFLSAFSAAAATGDADTIASRYTEDVVILEDGRVSYRGRAEVRDAIAAFPVPGGTNLEFSGTEITPIASDAALVQTLFSQDYGEAGFSFSGAISFLLIKRGGEWLIHRSHTSTARPSERDRQE